jgi:alkanesulfonate monooxygenase SsuD/methylene tetrahydromethanopterin reductase-like flavin-dependent oxidoreductase (luciferase family)
VLPPGLRIGLPLVADVPALVDLRLLRTIAKYVAPSPGKEPVKTYELYTKTRDLASNVTWEQLLEAGAVVCGDRDHCLERIADLQKRFGLTQILCWTRLGGLDHHKVLTSMQLMQKHVIPHFKRGAKEAR